MQAQIIVHEGGDIRRHAVGEWLCSAWLGLASVAYGIFCILAWQGQSVVFGTLLSIACGATYIGHRRFLDSFRQARALLRSLPDIPTARLLSPPRP